MAICKTCGQKYSRWTTSVGAHGVCSGCFEAKVIEYKVEPEDEEIFPTLLVPETRRRKRVAPIRLTSFLPRTRSKVVFILVVSCYCITVGRFMATSTWVAGVPPPPREFYLRGDAVDVFGLLVFGPLIESLMLVGVFELVRRLRAPDWVQVATSALFISELHVWPWWPHAFIVLPSFLIQSTSYFYWRHVSWKAAYWIIVCIHAINNVIPALGAIGRAMRHA